jgi:hypothetical protein
LSAVTGDILTLWFVVLAEGLDMFRLGPTAVVTGGNMKPFKNFGCMDAWVLNPEGWDRFG